MYSEEYMLQETLLYALNIGSPELKKKDIEDGNQ